MYISRSMRVVGRVICRAASGGPPSRPFPKWGMSGPGRVSFFGSCYTLLESQRGRGSPPRHEPAGHPNLWMSVLTALLHTSTASARFGPSVVSVRWCVRETRMCMALLLFRRDEISSDRSSTSVSVRRALRRSCAVAACIFRQVLVSLDTFRAIGVHSRVSRMPCRPTDS